MTIIKQSPSFRRWETKTWRITINRVSWTLYRHLVAITLLDVKVLLGWTLFPVLLMKIWGSERVNHLPKIAKLLHGGIGIQIPSSHYALLKTLDPPSVVFKTKYIKILKRIQSLVQIRKQICNCTYKKTTSNVLVYIPSKVPKFGAGVVAQR